MDRITFPYRGRMGMVFLAAAFLLWALPAQAIEISLAPAVTMAGPGQTFALDIKADTGADCINALEITVSFPSDIIRLNDFSRGGSIITFWMEFPDNGSIGRANESGFLTVSGGMPGGYCSHLITGTEGGGLVGRLIFEASESIADSQSDIAAKVRVIDPSRAYMHDGEGTEVKISGSYAEVNVAAGNEIRSSDWELELKSDHIPPEPFNLHIQRDDDFFDGKYFATFFTTDKQTGIDYYELIEERNGETGNSGWRKQDSPYVVKDQNLSSTIRVRAVDKAGNVTETSYAPHPDLAKSSGRNWLTPIILELLLGILIGISLVLLMHKKKR